ncbi:MAG TPA: NAD-dependent epimerase/dehydratase family protein [Acidimicrobiales bacterium]|jgi:nucleoside-diphosphate-sugar epimerase|nr:NAD-dependent epimerase/dehydratase family protein [Acidimicrobiales bacterium]
MRHDVAHPSDDPAVEPEGASVHRKRLGSVVIIGASSPLGRRVVDLTVRDEAVGRVVAVDIADPDDAGTPPVAALAGGTGASIERFVVMAGDDLRGPLAGATAVLYLGWAAAGGLSQGGSDRIVAVADAVLRATEGVAPLSLVVVSSAMVYGAWTTNPVPLTDAAPVRPNPGFAPALALAEVERRVADWHDDHPANTVAVLRPVTTVAPDRPGWLARALRSALGFPVEDHDPPTQFLHVDDLASAVDIVRRSGVEGTVNVAPDGWLDGAARRALDVRPRIRLPEAVAARLHGWRWRLGVAPTPPELLPYAVHPWVVANDKVRSAGWVPEHTNEEAWVAGHPAGPLATLSPQRRQELILGGAAVAAAGAGVVAGGAIRRRRRGG